MSYFWVALGGALGSVARYACSLGAARWLGTAFPWGTLFVNVAGSFAIGLLAALLDRRRPPARSASDARAFLMVGVLGGFTTFSSFSLETLSSRAPARSARRGANVALSLVLCLGGVWLGFVAAALVQSLRLGFSRCRSHALASKLRGGEVPEWPNGLDSKSSVRVIVPWVRIPPSPPAASYLIVLIGHFRRRHRLDPT